MAISCGILAKFTAMSFGKPENYLQFLRAAAWRPVWMQVDDVSLEQDEEFSGSFYLCFRMVGAVSFINYIQLVALVLF
uniref:Uncharacterized protein n=1 Tax=Solanum tuberosum TaxID=4113 RepID=M1AQS4_SOLTU